MKQKLKRFITGGLLIGLSSTVAHDRLTHSPYRHCWEDFEQHIFLHTFGPECSMQIDVLDLAQLMRDLEIEHFGETRKRLSDIGDTRNRKVVPHDKEKGLPE